MQCRPHDGEGAPEPEPPGLKAGLTAGGWFLLAGALGLGLAGLVWERNLLFLLACLAAGLLPAALLVAWRNLQGLSVRRRLPYPIHAGQVFLSQVDVASHRRGGASHNLILLDEVAGTGAGRACFASALRSVSAGETVAAPQQGRFFRHGRKWLKGITVISHFPLGLWRVQRWLPLCEEVIVFPRLYRLRRGALPPAGGPVQSCAVDLPGPAGEEEFAGLREFRPGDNPRWIHWRRSASLDEKLLLREFEGCMRRWVRIRFDATMSPDALLTEREVERQIAFLASILHGLVCQGHMVSLRVWEGIGWGCILQSDPRALWEVFARLARLTAGPGPECPRWEEDEACGAGPYLQLSLREPLSGESALESLPWRHPEFPFCRGPLASA